MALKKKIGIGHNQPSKPYDGVFFTMGPISIHQFSEFSKRGVNALRIFQYIRTKQGLNGSKWNSFVLVDNIKLQEWFGCHQSRKWKILNKLEEAKLIKLKRRGVGKAPYVQIVCAERKLN